MYVSVQTIDHSYIYIRVVSLPLPPKITNPTRPTKSEQAVCAVSLGLLISAFAPDVPSATALAPPVTIVFMLVGCVSGWMGVDFGMDG